MRAWARRMRSELRLLDGRGTRYSTVTRLQLVGPLPLDAPPAAICLCTVLRCLARVRLMAPMAGVGEGGGLGEGGVVGAGEGEGVFNKFSSEHYCFPQINPCRMHIHPRPISSASTLTVHSFFKHRFHDRHRPGKWLQAGCPKKSKRVVRCKTQPHHLSPAQ